MKKNLSYLLLLLVAFSIIYSCSKTKNSEIADKNVEKLLYQKETSPNATKNNSEIDLQDRIQKSVQIYYQNDFLETLRANDKWKAYIKSGNYILDEATIKKTTIAESDISLVTISFKNEKEKGFFNIYTRNDNFFWTKVLIIDLADNKKTYKFTSEKDELLLKLDIKDNTEVSNFSSSDFNTILKDNPAFKSISKKSSEVGVNAFEPEFEGGPDCFKKGITYWKCLDCILLKHCGGDLACTIACTVWPEVCLGVAVLACLPVTN